MKLGKFLLTKTEVGDIILFRIGGWQVGCTMIDHEDLFIGSLNNSLLQKEVENFYYEKQEWATKNVMIVDIR